MRNFSIVVSTEQQLNKVREKALKYGYKESVIDKAYFKLFPIIVYFINVEFGICAQSSHHDSITRKNRFYWFSQKKQAKDFMKANIGYNGFYFQNPIHNDISKSSFSKEKLFMPIGVISKNFINECEAIRKELFRLDGKPEPINRDKCISHEAMSWDDLGTIDGFIVNDFGFIKEYKGANTGDDHYKTAWATHKQAMGSIAMAQLSQLLKDFNKDDKIGAVKHSIRKDGDLIIVVTSAKEFLSFNSVGSAKEFLNRHRKLIETYFNMF